jgi:hypothetical protein
MSLVDPIARAIVALSNVGFSCTDPCTTVISGLSRFL